MTNAIPILLMLIGIGLLVIEMFIPNFGITGTVGVIAILVGVITSAKTLMGGVILFLIIIAIAAVLMFIAYRIVASKKSPFVLTASLKKEEDSDLQYFVGMEGTALTPLRPSGTGEFNGVRLDVLTQGNFISKDQPIKIIEIQGKKIIVDQKN